MCARSGGEDSANAPIHERTFRAVAAFCLAHLTCAVCLEGSGPISLPSIGADCLISTFSPAIVSVSLHFHLHQSPSFIESSSSSSDTNGSSSSSSSTLCLPSRAPAKAQALAPLHKGTENCLAVCAFTRSGPVTSGILVRKSCADDTSFRMYESSDQFAPRIFTPFISIPPPTLSKPANIGCAPTLYLLGDCIFPWASPSRWTVLAVRCPWYLVLYDMFPATATS